MKQFAFLEPLEDIIVDHFGVLDDHYSRDMAKELLPELTAAIERENEIRYVLIDGQTGQLESRLLYEVYEEAQEAVQQATWQGCLIGTLIVEQ